MALFFCGKHILRPKTYLQSIRNYGYIVLVPEIGEELPEKNPLLHNNGLPEFNNITIENCMAAIAKQTLDFENGVKKIEKHLSSAQQQQQPVNIFEQIFQPLEELGGPLNMTWGLSKTLYLGNSTKMPTKSYMSIHERAKRARAVKFNSPLIYQTIKNELMLIEKHPQNIKGKDEDLRMLSKFSLEGKLNGLELDENKQGIRTQYLHRLVKEQAFFRHKFETATKQFTHLIDDQKIIRDFPENLIKTIAIDRGNYLRGPLKLTLQPNVYSAIMEYCSDRDIRWNLWRASVSRGSGYNNKELSTSIHLEEIRSIRRDIARLLGYETFAEMSMETKMAGSVENVKNMLNILLERARPIEERELEGLQLFAEERGFKNQLDLWDIPYWRRKQLHTVHEYPLASDEDFRDYFPLGKVLNGLFEFSEKLLNVTIRQRNNVSTWHKDVKFYDIFEANNSAPIAGFYIDPYARSDEKIRPQSNNINGWMVGIQSQSRIADTTPLVALIFNFEPPGTQNQMSRESCLTFNQVKTLFHRFGQGLQHLLTRTNYSEVSGSSNIEWDAVDVCGQVFSHFLYNKSVIDSISSHYQSDDKLPEKFYKSLVEARKHFAAHDLCLELYLSALDLELHSSQDFWLDIVKRLWPEYRCFQYHKIDSHPCSFTQIFTEEWPAAYYSHLWSRMLAADVYSAFHEVLHDDQKISDVGKRFRDTFLMFGGSCHPAKVFRKFRGRDPSPKALLSSLGLKNKV